MPCLQRTRMLLRTADLARAEDAEKGMQAANAAGIPVIVIRTLETRDFDFSDADLAVYSHAEFLELVRHVSLR